MIVRRASLRFMWVSGMGRWPARVCREAA